MVAFHGRRFQFREYALLDNLFDDEWNGNDEIRFYFFECLEDNFRTRHTGEEVDVAADGELIEELEGQSVHMCHRKHGDDLVSGFQFEHFIRELGVRPEATVGEHDSF